MASVQAALDLWQCCERHRISFREIKDLFSRCYPAEKIATANDATIAEMIGHIERVERARHELLANKPAASAPLLPMRQPAQAETAIDDEADRDDDNDEIDLSTDADRYPRPKGDEADAFDVHDNTIGYDQPDEDEEDENFPEPDDIAPIEPAAVAVQPVAPSPVAPPAEWRTPASQPVVTKPPSARLPRRRPPIASPASAPPAKSDEQPASPKGLMPRTGMGFVPTTPSGYADLSPEAIKKATWDKPVPIRRFNPLETMSMSEREAARPSQSAAHTPSPSAASTSTEPYLRPIRRPAWLGTIAEEDPPD